MRDEIYSHFAVAGGKWIEITLNFFLPLPEWEIHHNYVTTTECYNKYSSYWKELGIL